VLDATVRQNSPCGGPPSTSDDELRSHHRLEHMKHMPDGVPGRRLQEFAVCLAGGVDASDGARSPTHSTWRRRSRHPVRNALSDRGFYYESCQIPRFRLLPTSYIIPTTSKSLVPVVSHVDIRPGGARPIPSTMVAQLRSNLDSLVAPTRKSATRSSRPGMRVSWARSRPREIAHDVRAYGRYTPRNVRRAAAGRRPENSVDLRGKTQLDDASDLLAGNAARTSSCPGITRRWRRLLTDRAAAISRLSWKPGPCTLSSADGPLRAAVAVGAIQRLHTVRKLQSVVF